MPSDRSEAALRAWATRRGGAPASQDRPAPRARAAAPAPAAAATGTSAAPAEKSPGRRAALSAWATRRTRAAERERAQSSHIPRTEEPKTHQKAFTFEPRGTRTGTQKGLALGAPKPVAQRMVLPRPATPAGAIKIPERNAKERAAVIAENVVHLAAQGHAYPESVARGLDAFFGSKSPKISELEQGYGAKGFKTKLNHISAGPHGVSLSARVTDPTTGESVTHAFNRDFKKMPDGTVHAYHAHFAVDAGFRSGGVGKRLLSNSIRLQHELGVRHLETGPAGSDGARSYDSWKANQDKIRDLVKQNKAGTLPDAQLRGRLREAHREYYRGGSGYIGPHAWASMGFQWPESEGRAIGAHFAAYLQSHHGMTRDQASSAAAPVEQNPRALVEYRTPAGKEAGSHFMSEFVGSARSHWHVEMNKSNPGWQHMKKKLGLHDLEP